MADLIDRQAAIDAICMEWCCVKNSGCQHVYDIRDGEYRYCDGCDDVDVIKALPSAQPEPLTDKEQRIFLAAMGREEEVCKQTDEECRDCREPYEDSLVWVCKEIVRKVKGALWQ